ncbi:MAG: heparinase II/III domain-containing protein [Gemmatimonadota bacterium]
MSNLRRLARLPGLTLTEVRDRTAQKAAALAERSGVVRAGTDFASLRRRLAPAFQTLDERTLGELLVSGPRPHLSAGLANQRETADLVRRRWPDHVTAITLGAEGILRGQIELLGCGQLVVGERPDWKRDPVSGIRAPGGHWSTIDYLDAAKTGDHKITWELNRHQFLVNLALAWQLTADPRYAARAVELIRDWMDANPPKEGINWASSLEVAYRLVAWSWTQRLLGESGAIDPATASRWLAFVDVSARHIERYLSTWFSPNTHLTGEALGLVYAGTLFPELDGASRWRARGLAILDGQLPVHIRPDGTYFEQAFQYHRYTLDICLHARLLAPGQSRQLDRAIAGLSRFMAWVTRPDGSYPLLGDDDGGKVLFLDQRAPDDARSSLALAAIMLQDPELRAASGDATAELAWMAGAAGVTMHDGLAPSTPRERARVFADGGFIVSRNGWAASSSVMTIDCGPLGMGNGGHAHADTLSFDLTVAGQPVIVDPGTVSYTTSPEERDAMRHSHAHNTVTVDGISSSIPAGPFHWRSMARGTVELWYDSGDVIAFRGSHDGYSREGETRLHRRTMLALPGHWWIIRDELIGFDATPGDHHADATFQFAAGMEVETDGDTLKVGCRGQQILALTAFEGNGSWYMTPGIASRRYGSRPAAARARYRFHTGASSRCGIAITAGWTAKVSFTARPDGGQVRLTNGKFEDLINLSSATGNLPVYEAAHGLTTDAALSWLRRPADAGPGSATTFVAAGGTFVEANGDRMTVNQGVTLDQSSGRWLTREPTQAQQGPGET